MADELLGKEDEVWFELPASSDMVGALSGWTPLAVPDTTNATRNSNTPPDYPPR